MRSFLFLLALPLFGGSSLNLSGSQTASNSSVAAQGINAGCRWEFQVTFPTATPTATGLPVINACGINPQLTASGGGALQIYAQGLTGGASPPIAYLSAFSGVWLICRFQEIPSGAGGNETLECWDVNGIEQTSDVQAYTGSTGSNSNGAAVGGYATGDTAWGFSRLSATTVPVGSPPPTFAQNGNLLEWKFDGALTDSSGNGYTATSSAGTPAGSCGSTPCYSATTGQNRVFPAAYSRLAANEPGWMGAYPTVGLTWDTSGNHVNYLDCTASFTWTDAGGQPSCAWSVTSGPNTPTITSASSTVTTVTGTAFGAYAILLTATDAASNVATFTLNVGAQSCDANGVAHPADPNVNLILGYGSPMICFGYSPWSYMDERDIFMITAQYASNGWGPANFATNTTWTTPGAGTVSYPFAGIGPGPGQTGTTLTGSGITSATITSFTIADASKLPGLASLPDWILVGSGYGGQSGEMIRITGTTAITGAATLTVGYNGRGMPGAPWTFGGTNVVVPAQAWPSGAVVGEYRISGSGTSFQSDANRPLCPAGVPGPPGPIVYSTGSVQLSASSPTVTGISTVWNAGNAIYGNSTLMIRVAATHASGTPFVWWGTITGLGSTTSLTASVNAPADVDTLTNFSYAITGPLYVSLEFTSFGGTQRAEQNLMGCESQTAAFAVPAHDVTSLDQTTFSGVHYSYKLGPPGIYSQFGSNFYGTGLAALNFYESSGYGPALTLASNINDYFCRDPEIGSGYVEGSPLYYIGGYAGCFAQWLLSPTIDPATPQTAADMRPWASNGAGWLGALIGYGSATCNETGGYDPRDQSGEQLPVVLAAIWDPDTTYQATWLTAMGSAGGGAGMLGRDTTCKRTDNSFAVPILNGVSVTLTNGSATGTGTGLNAVGPSGGALCAGVGTGTITVANGSAGATLVTGSLGTLATNFNILIWDTTSSPNYVGAFAFIFSGSSVTLAGPWPGASGTFTFIVNSSLQSYFPGNSSGVTVIGNGDFTDTDNLRQTETWGCTQVSSTQITLNRPWNDAVTGGSMHPSGTYLMEAVGNYALGIAGYYIQPYMHGHVDKKLAFAAMVPNSTVASGYAALQGPVAAWFYTTGFDINTLGTYYARVQSTCEPFITANSSTLFAAIHGNESDLNMCGFSGLAATLGGGVGEFTERADSAEAFASVNSYFITQCRLGIAQCNAARTFGDTVYGAVFGNPSMTTAGYYADSHYVNTAGELSNEGLSTYRWPGFFFGFGNSRVWPALRLQGLNVSPAGTLTGAGTLIGVGAGTAH